MSRTPEKSERGPVEMVESKGVKIPIYYSPYRETESYLLAYYSEGKRRRERAPSLPAARKRAKELIEELSKGIAHVATFTPKEAAAVNTAVDILQPLDIGLTEAARQVAAAKEILGDLGTIEEAARLLVAERQRQKLPVKLFGDVVNEFLEEIKPPARSYRHWSDCSGRLSLASEKFATVPISDIRTIDLEEHLNCLRRRVRTKTGMKTLSGPGKKATGRNRNNYRGVLCNLFSFAQRRGYLPRGVETEAEHIREAPDRDANVEIYRPEEMQAILDGLPDKWIPYAAIGAFAGCRGAEIHRLDWKDIDLEERHITVESSKSKTGKRRVVPISDNLYAFLAPYARESGWVCPHYSHDSTLAQEFALAWERAGIKVRKVNNGLRHSYASYRIEEVKSLPQVAWEMNTSERKLRDNYLELVSAKKLAQWKQIMPSSPLPKVPLD
jgi:integrase